MLDSNLKIIECKTLHLIYSKLYPFDKNNHRKVKAHMVDFWKIKKSGDPNSPEWMKLYMEVLESLCIFLVNSFGTYGCCCDVCRLPILFVQILLEAIMAWPAFGKKCPMLLRADAATVCMELRTGVCETYDECFILYSIIPQTIVSFLVLLLNRIDGNRWSIYFFVLAFVIIPVINFAILYFCPISSNLTVCIWLS